MSLAAKLFSLAPATGGAAALSAASAVHPHPLLVQALKPLRSHNIYSRWAFLMPRNSSQRNAATAEYLDKLIARWRKNFSRIYARRILELAAASAAAQVMRSAAEANTISKPLEWQGWEQKNWEETALASVGSTKFARFWMATKRVVNLAILASPFIALAPLSLVSDQAYKISWNYALWGIEKAGPTWIKLTQWASTRQDLFSPEFCQHFSKLQDDTEGHSWEETKKVLKEQFGEKGMEALEINSTPIGSGCIAQVYQGRLKEASVRYPKDTKVAIKVQHPGIWNKVCVDFYIFNKIAKFLEDLPRLNLQFLSLVDTVHQFRDVMIPQLDLSIEASHLNRFNQNFANDEQVAFPRPLEELTTSKVLVETFCEGTPIINFVKGNRPIEEKELLARIGLRMTLQMIFLHDFIHGDLHPGNILVSGTYPDLKYQVLDCGLALEMGPKQHENIVKVLGAFTRKDGRTAGSTMVDMKSESQASPEGRELFIEGIEQICILDGDQNFIENVGDYITDICSLACIHRVKLEGAFLLRQK
ncbi:unnamed protein product [Pseudo-nitzschia multistriata]|uniref:Protein kinase domain-containing protein n=1 Tax=Pseudo-nitzschia multistriata TaxID=183589 RepID=A0A448ZEV7_9STRA|nr:unnamed protein product [Pseudo-nitzschia multistriata]